MLSSFKMTKYDVGNTLQQNILAAALTQVFTAYLLQTAIYKDSKIFVKILYHKMSL